MLTMRLWRSDPGPTHVEPMAPGHDEEQGADQADVCETLDAQATAHNYDFPEDLRGENAVFGLIGTPVAAGLAQARHTRDTQSLQGACDPPAARGPERDDDLIKTLQAQYWRALDDPQASLAGEWTAPATLA